MLTGCILVYAMIIIGGTTRLTGSGLSMTDWNLIMGAIPPMNAQDWQETFDQYKQFPQYKLVNRDMSLAEFKNIFFWEYLHRVWGRMIGVVFMVPFIIFLIRKQISRTLLPKLLIILFMGAFQGVLGWIMVKSGLVDKPWVSPYRLTAHLITALILYAYLFWLTMDHLFTPSAQANDTGLKKWSWWLTALIGLQIFFGGFMSGTKAGLFYPTFPTMNGAWIPEDLFVQSPFWVNIFENVATIQFIHRGLAYFLAVFIGVFWLRSRKTINSPPLQNAFLYLWITLGLQLFLGIHTLINCQGQIPVLLGVLHQGGAVLLLTAALNINYQLGNSQTRPAPV